MSVAKVIELIAVSKTSFEDAIQQGVKRATSTLKNVSGIWIKDQSMNIEGGKVTGYRVMMHVTFVLGDGSSDDD